MNFDSTDRLQSSPACPPSGWASHTRARSPRGVARWWFNDLGRDWAGGSNAPGTDEAVRLIESGRRDGDGRDRDVVTEADRIVQAAVDTFGRLDIVVNNAEPAVTSIPWWTCTCAARTASPRPPGRTCPPGQRTDPKHLVERKLRRPRDARLRGREGRDPLLDANAGDSRQANRCVRSNAISPRPGPVPPPASSSRIRGVPAGALPTRGGRGVRRVSPARRHHTHRRGIRGGRRAGLSGGAGRDTGGPHRRAPRKHGPRSSTK